MVDSDAGSLVMIHGLNMQSGFLGKKFDFYSIISHDGVICILNVSFVVDVNTFCKKRAKNLFIRFKQDFQDFLNKYVKP